MVDLVLTTFDWVPEMPRGFVRDLRVRWALEEAGLPYRVESAPFRDRERRAFRAPALRPGAVADRWRHLDLRERRDPASSRRAQRRADARRSARPQRGDGMAVRGAQFGRDGEPALVAVACSPATPAIRRHGSVLDDFLKARLQHMEPVLAGREWLAGTFSVADILMADVLRLVDRFDGLADYPACRHYVARATARPAFVKAHADQMAHFAAAD